MKDLERKPQGGRISVYPRHASTWNYLGWAALYLFVGLHQLSGGHISKEFAEIIFIDFLINLASPFILGGIVFLNHHLGSGIRGIKRHEFVVIGSVFSATILLPGIFLFEIGGLVLFLSALLFFVRLGWYGPLKERGKVLSMLFIRGLAGPFVFFVPALLISTIAVGRSTLETTETDWVALFGVIYFLLQAAFEEFMLRRSEKVSLDTSESLLQVRHLEDQDDTSRPSGK